MDNRVKENKLNLILLEFFGVFFTIAVTIVIAIFANTSPLIASEQNQQDSVTIRNDKYQFEITVPKTWTYKRGIQPDPDEGMKSGEASFSMSVGDASDCDCNYNLFVQCRYVALYKNGMRVIIHYFLPASDPALFEKYALEVDAVIQALSIE